MVSLERCIESLKEGLRGVIMRSAGAWLTYHVISYYWYSLRDVMYIHYMVATIKYDI